jgi:hypothetical protein
MMKTPLSQMIKALSLAISLAAFSASADTTNIVKFSQLPVSTVISNADGLAYYWKSNNFYIVKRIAWSNFLATLEMAMKDTNLTGLYFTNMTVVDGLRGNDATAVHGDPNHPFVSISNAQANATTGMVIIVRAGNYTVPILGYNSQEITNFAPIWYLDPGAQVMMDNGAHFGNSNYPFPVTILGHGSIQNNFDIGFGTTPVYIECANFNTNSPLPGQGTEYDLQIFGTNQITIKADTEIRFSTLGAPLIVAGNCSFFAPLIRFNEQTVTGAGTNCTLKVIADTIEFRANDSAYTFGTNFEFVANCASEITDFGSAGIDSINYCRWQIGKTTTWGADTGGGKGQFNNVQFVNNPSFQTAILTSGIIGSYQINGVLIGNGSGLTKLNQWDSVTNTFSGTSFLLGTNSFISSGSNIGFTGVANVPASLLRYGQLTIKATGNITVTNPATWKTSDMAVSRVCTNGNFLTMAVEVMPGIYTNAAICQFY